MNVRHTLPALLLAAALAMAATGCNSEKPAGEGPDAATSSVVRPGDPWSTAQVIRPADLAAQLQDAAAPKPMLLHVGFRRLFDQGGIPGSKYAGPGQTDEGVTLLEQTMASEPRDRDVVLYCGCCPWKDCPNMAPAFRKLADMGFTHVRALHVEKNFTADWVEKGYPVDAPTH